MKKFTSLLIGCSITLAAAAWAQQPEASSTPENKKNKQQGAEQASPAQHRPSANARESEGTRPTPAMNERREGKRHEARKDEQSANETQTGATPATEQAGEGKKARREHAASTSASPAAGEANATQSASPEQTRQGKKGMKNRAANAKASATPAASAATSAAPAASANAAVSGQQNAQVNATGKVKKVDQPQLQQIKTQHASFKAQAKPQQAPAVTFNQNYRIQEAQTWTGPQYEVFRSYHPERHDEGWYHSHYGRVELIGGGYYYFNNGYWYPAWGYNPSAEYYAYDGPIYVGHQAKPWDQVIADVQAELQQMGYYRGEVDGLLGPLTREALTAYQHDQGLIATAVIDEPTLDSLGLS
jgi:Putative peptidoglycan binding domain